MQVGEERLERWIDGLANRNLDVLVQAGEEAGERAGLVQGLVEACSEVLSVSRWKGKRRGEGRGGPLIHIGMTSGARRASRRIRDTPHLNRRGSCSVSCLIRPSGKMWTCKSKRKVGTEGKEG